MLAWHLETERLLTTPILTILSQHSLLVFFLRDFPASVDLPLPETILNTHHQINLTQFPLCTAFLDPVEPLPSKAMRLVNIIVTNSNIW